MLYIIKEHVYLLAKLGLAVGPGSSSSINGSDETLGCESLPLSHIRSMEDEALKFVHVAREEEASCNRSLEIVPHHLRIKMKRNSPTWQKSKRFDEYIRYAY